MPVPVASPPARPDGSAEAGSAEAGSAEAGSAEAGSAEAGSAEAGSAEAGSAEAGSAEAGSAEADRLRAILDALPQRVFWKHRDLTYAGCNLPFARDAGLESPAAIVGLCDHDLPWSEAETDQFRTDDRAVIATGERRHLLEPQRDANGLDRWLDTRKQPWTDAAGATVGVLGTFVEVAQREEIEKEAAVTRERLELALSSGEAGLWDWNVPTDAAFFSDVWCRMLGYRRDELEQTGAAFLALIHPDDQAATTDLIGRHFAGGTDLYEATLRLRRRGGGWVWVRARGRVVERDAAGAPVRMVGLHTDVTDQKQAEAALREAEERFRSGFEQSGVPTCLCDLDGRITRVNAAFGKLLGRPDGVAGQTFEAVTHPDDAARCRRRFDRFVAGPADTDHWEKRYVRADGETVSALLNLTMLRDGDGSPREILVQGQDVTDRNRAEAQLKRQEDALRHKHRMEAVGSLAGGIAHEFNNLLQAVGGYAQFAKDGLEDLPDGPAREVGAQIAADLDQIAEATARAAELTRQMLDFSRRDARAKAPLDAREELRSLDKMIRPLIGERVDLCIAAPAGDIGTVLADRTELQQALMNLCVNARDAMGGAGTLTLSLETVTLSDSAADAGVTDADADAGPEQGALGGPVPAGQYARFAVTDTGPGVPEAVRGQIFDPFFTTKPPGEGTGMGLATVYTAAEQHGGRVVLRTGRGGATFALDLPLVGRTAAAALAPPAAAPQSAAPPARPRVLLAEDEPLVREVAVRSLRRAGFDPVAVGRGDDAVEAYERHGGEFALLLFDMVMPGLTGREAYERIRQTAAGRPGGPPVLFCTGYDPESDKAVKQCAGLPQVRKPIAPGDLVAAVRDTIAAAL